MATSNDGFPTFNVGDIVLASLSITDWLYPNVRCKVDHVHHTGADHGPEYALVVAEGESKGDHILRLSDEFIPALTA